MQKFIIKIVFGATAEKTPIKAPNLKIKKSKNPYYSKSLSNKNPSSKFFQKYVI